jgi:hypothetical protein
MAIKLTTSGGHESDETPKNLSVNHGGVAIVAAMMEVIAIRQERVFIVGDINIRSDLTDDPDTVRFLDMITSYGFLLHALKLICKVA